MSEPLQKLDTNRIPVEYYSNGLMKYHPDYHPNHGKRFSEAEYEYLCKYYEIDGVELMSYALGRPPKSIIQRVHVLKKQKLFTYYKELNKYW